MTTALYLEDAYKTICETEVIKVEGNKVYVKETVFIQLVEGRNVIRVSLYKMDLYLKLKSKEGAGRNSSLYKRWSSSKFRSS